MKIKPTKVFKRLVENKTRLNIFYGGSSSSKTISILQYLTLYAFKYPNKRITLSSESSPKMKITIIRDWIDIVMGDLFEPQRFNKTDGVYKFPNGSTFTFIGADQPERFKGPRQHITYFDEVNHIKHEIFQQADIRTDDMMFVSFNPASKFWIEDYWDLDNSYVDHSTYKDNTDNLSEDIIIALESREKSDKNFYNVYTLGNWGSLEGLIFAEGINWHITDSMPGDYKERLYGMDFGFSVDPASIIDIRYSDGNIYVSEILYKLNQTNQDLIPYLDIKTVADSAEPKSIEEIRRAGVDIIPAMKGPGSINTGIKRLKEFNIYVDKRSINIIKEFRNYKWATNKHDEMTVKPIDNFNHAIDAIRYGVFEMFNKQAIFFI